MKPTIIQLGVMTQDLFIDRFHYHNLDTDLNTFEVVCNCGDDGSVSGGLQKHFYETRIVRLRKIEYIDELGDRSSVLSGTCHYCGQIHWTEGKEEE